MKQPRRHHYVPQFYQRRLADSDGKFFVWDKTSGRDFIGTPTSIAVEADFYRLHHYESLGFDAFAMEKQLSSLEAETALITDQWIAWLRSASHLDRIPVPAVNREIFAQFLAVQHLRTADTRDLLAAFRTEYITDEALTEAELTNLHAELLWDLDTVHSIRDMIRNSLWVFARTDGIAHFITSDNPVCFRTNDNKLWVKTGFMNGETYIVYPLSPDLVIFCYSGEKWLGLNKFADCLSPVVMDHELAQSENSGQVFMARRFLISSKAGFSAEKEFAEAIGTDTYKPD